MYFSVGFVNYFKNMRHNKKMDSLDKMAPEGFEPPTPGFLLL